MSCSRSATFGIAFNHLIETGNHLNSRSFSPRAAVIMTPDLGDIFKTKSLGNTSQRLRVLWGILLSGCFCLVFSFLLVTFHGDARPAVKNTLK